ncbi:MAG: hypothetical protein HOE14_10525 [Gemmatimonadales bacterium]|nr:hypothetical protein [Gemmatimonadales bacterium]
MVITLIEAAWARELFSGIRTDGPGWYHPQEVGVYTALADLYDTAARGAGAAGNLRQARILDAHFQGFQYIADMAVGRRAETAV